MGTEGLDAVVKALNAKISEIEGATEKGMREAALRIRRSALPRTPLVTGNLRDSAFVVARAFTEGGGNDPDHLVSEELAVVRSSKVPMASIGYTARYAAAVHENPKAGKSGRPGASVVGEWKFLETTVKERSSEVLELISREVKRMT